MERIVVLTGAGISAESGIKTFRDSDGLWNNYRMEDVASPVAWNTDMDMVLEFYNQRRKNLYESNPNDAHYALAELEDKYDVQIITQNVDDLHEQAGSTRVLHLHGELKKARSTADPSLIYEINGWELKCGDKCKKGSQLRPHIVWFGEPVPNIALAAEISSTADLYIVIGTSLVVYPAAGLINYAPAQIKKYLIDPAADDRSKDETLTIFKEKAGIAVPALVKHLLN